MSNSFQQYAKMSLGKDVNMKLSPSKITGNASWHIKTVLDLRSP
jgi:hypothetical protein